MLNITQGKNSLSTKHKQNEEENLFEVTATLIFYCENGTERYPKEFTAKSSRRWRVSGFGREMGSNISLETFREMKDEAKKEVLFQFFKEVCGYTDNNNIEIDELYRPLISTPEF